MEYSIETLITELRQTGKYLHIYYRPDYVCIKVETVNGESIYCDYFKPDFPLSNMAIICRKSLALANWLNP